jgi:hypothetical protein
MNIFISVVTLVERPSYNNTMTVGELKKLLSNYEDNTKIYLKEKSNSLSFCTMDVNNITSM